MSNALFCDSCGNIFPEDAEGSVSGNGTFTRTVDGVRKQLQRRTDQCPECAQAQAQRWNGARTLETPATERAKQEVLRTVNDKYRDETYQQNATGGFEANH